MVTKAEKRALRLKQKKSEVKKQRNAAAKRRRNKKIMNYSIIGVVLLLIAGTGLSQYIQAQGPGEYDDLAFCMTSAGIGMYGTEWCPHCQEQKRVFGNSFKHVIYINCDANPTACSNQQVASYPTWITADGKRLNGVQSLESLAEITGCSV